MIRQIITDHSLSGCLGTSWAPLNEQANRLGYLPRKHEWSHTSNGLLDNSGRAIEKLNDSPAPRTVGYELIPMDNYRLVPSSAHRVYQAT